MDDDQSIAQPSYAWPDASGFRVGVRYPDVQWRLYALNEDQLANLEKGADSISLGLLGLFGGIAFSALTTLLTVDLPNRTLGVFVGIFVGAIGLSIWFTYQTWQDRRSMQKLVAHIRDQHAR